MLLKRGSLRQKNTIYISASIPLMVLFNGSFARDILILISETKSNPVNQRKVFRSIQDMDRLNIKREKWNILRHCLVLFMLRPWWYLLSFDGGYQISHWYLYRQKGFHTSLHIVTGTWNTGIFMPQDAPSSPWRWHNPLSQPRPEEIFFVEIMME